jgi:ABC-type branched-subunit amino acid transport system ATPase component
MLEVASISKSFGGVRAVSNVSFAVAQGRIIGLIGTNGAGKTTLFNVITGIIRADAGKVAFEQRDITGRSPHEIAKLGLIRSFQTPIGFPRLTVLENMLVFDRGADRSVGHALLDRGADRVSREVFDRAREILMRFGLAGRQDVWVQDLSAPELKMLEFARTTMAGPKLLLLDEPAAGVNPALLENLIATIHSLRDQDVTFLIVDHNLKFICSVCDAIYAMADGEIIAEGEPLAVVSDQRVVDCYIGKAPARRRAPALTRPN